MGGCAHALDLLFKDACAHAWAKELFEQGRTVVKWVEKRGIPFRVFHFYSEVLHALLPTSSCWNDSLRFVMHSSRL
jgi:hypothetical protein